MVCICFSKYQPQLFSFFVKSFAAADDKRGSGSLGGYLDPLSSGFRPNQESPVERGLKDAILGE